MTDTKVSITFTGVLKSIGRVVYRHFGTYALVTIFWGLATVTTGWGVRAVYPTLESAKIYPAQIHVLRNPVVFALFLGSLLAFLFFYSFFIRLFVCHLKDEESGLQTHLKAVIGQFHNVVLYFFLFLLLLTLLLLPMGPKSSHVMGIFDLFRIFVLPFVALAVLWYISFTSYFVLPELMFEQRSVSGAFRRSKELLEGLRLRIFGYNLFVFVLPAAGMFWAGLNPVINQDSTAIWIQFFVILGVIILIYTIVSAGLMSTLYMQRRANIGDLTENEFLHLFD